LRNKEPTKKILFNSNETSEKNEDNFPNIIVQNEKKNENCGLLSQKELNLFMRSL